MMPSESLKTPLEARATNNWVEIVRANTGWRRRHVLEDQTHDIFFPISMDQRKKKGLYSALR